VERERAQLEEAAARAAREPVQLALAARPPVLAPRAAPLKGAPQPLNLPAALDPNDGHPRIYGILREGPAATRAWSERYLQNNGLHENVAKLYVDGVGIPREPRESDADEPPPAVVVDWVICECGVLVHRAEHLAEHRAGDVHAERLAVQGERAAAERMAAQGARAA
jgi:hypothetical protein